MVKNNSLSSIKTKRNHVNTILHKKMDYINKVCIYDDKYNESYCKLLFYEIQDIADECNYYDDLINNKSLK